MSSQKISKINESLNNVWNRVSKNVFVDKDTLEMGVRGAILPFNDGSVGRLGVLRELGVKDLGKHTVAELNLFNDIQLLKDDLAVIDMTKEARRYDMKERRRILHHKWFLRL